MATPRERFEEITHTWWLSEPALFAVFCKHNLHENNSLPIPLRSGKGMIEYNSEQVDLLSDPALEQLLKVEMVRLCLRHPYERQPTGCCAQALHMGSDMVVEPAYNVPLAELTKPSDMNLPEGQHFEWYADRVNELLRETLKQQKSQQEDGEADQEPGDVDQKGTDQQSGDTQDGKQSGDQKDGEPQGKDREGGPQSGGKKSGQQSGGKASDGGSKSADGESGEPNGDAESETDDADQNPSIGGDPYVELWQEDEEMKEQLKEVLEKVTNWGTLSGRMVEVIQKALAARIDYRKVLRAFQTSIISTNRSLTRMRPNRRFGFDAMGSKHDLSSRLLVAVDVSGSVSSAALSKFFRVISDFFKYGVEAIDVIQFDAAVSKDVVQLKQGCRALRSDMVDVHGRGGTNFQCVINYLHDHNNYDGLIIFTDGYAPAPVINFPTRTKLLWVTEDERQYNQHKNWMSRTGRSCFIM